MHSGRLVHSWWPGAVADRRFGARGAYRRRMRTELPGERLHRRLGAAPAADSRADPDAADDTGEDTDPNSLLPRWIPDSSTSPGWLARVRADPARAGALALAVIAALAVLVTVFTLMRGQPAAVSSAKLPPVQMASSATRAPTASPPAKPDSPLVVSVVGLVHTPGLVTLAPGARIADALKSAGGTVDGADTIGLNMARPVNDGEQILVGVAPRAGQPTALGSSVSSGSATSRTSASPGQTAGSTATKPAELVDLNTATVQELDALPGVGPVTAAAIVKWRDAHGKFDSVDQLAEVDGIGPARLEKLRALVHV